MSRELQHCPTCDEEYVAGVASCVECGGPLQPGPLARLERRARGAAGAPPSDAGTAGKERLLAELPGLQADHAVRALLLEGIACSVQCHGVTKQYAPDQPPKEPFAMTLPVAVYVSDAQYDAAHDIVASFQADDVIGDQWADAEAEADDETAVEVESSAEPAAESEHVLAGAPFAGDEPAPESTSLRTAVLIVIAALILLFLFGR